MSYNIRGYIPCDKYHWHDRKDLILNIIKEEKPDILGLQEVFKIKEEIHSKCNNIDAILGYKYDVLLKKDFNQLKSTFATSPSFLLRDYFIQYLKELNYDYYFKPESKTPKIIFFNKNSFKFIKGDEIVFDEKSFSTYVFLQNLKTLENILIINVHLKSGLKEFETREKQINSIIKSISKFNQNTKIILMGDFNININSKEYKKLEDRLNNLDLFTAENNISMDTYNGFNIKEKKIDYIFLSKSFKINYTKTNNTVFYKNGKIIFPSDHWPLKVGVE